jgi:hypothetical protein
VVEEAVRVSNDLLSALLVSVISLVGGYYFGVVRSRNERRDEAIAAIYKEMMVFYRGIVGWIYCCKRLRTFMDVFVGYEIWLDEDTHKLI